MIARATSGEAGVLHALETACFDEPWSEKSLLPLLENPDYLVLVERNESRDALGYLIGWQVGEDAELARIGVLRAARGQGIAGQLLNESLQIWRGRGVGNVWLEVREGNEVARHLYRSRGFSEVGKRPNYYADGETALVLRLVVGL